MQKQSRSFKLEQFAHLYLSRFPQSRQEDELSSLTAAAYPAIPVISSSLSVFVQLILTVQHGVTSTAFMTAIKSPDRAEDVAVMELFSEENARKIKLVQYKTVTSRNECALFYTDICQLAFFYSLRPTLSKFLCFSLHGEQIKERKWCYMPVSFTISLNTRIFFSYK